MTGRILGAGAGEVLDLETQNNGMKSANRSSPEHGGREEREGRVLSGRLSMNVLEGEIIGWRFWFGRGRHLGYPARGKSMSGILLCRFRGAGGGEGRQLRSGGTGQSTQ